MAGNGATLMIRLVTDASKAQAGMGKAADSAEKTQGRIKSAMGKVALAIGGAFAADKIIGFAKESITAASDLSETMSKTGQIFGASSDAIIDWSKNSSVALGLSQKDALDAADTFAIFGKAAGLTGSDLTDFSKSLTGTAADFASFANTTPQEAIDAIGAALRGETEPIRKYGVMLNDASIKNEALRLGLIKTTKVPIDPKKRALAVKSLIDKFAKGQKITGDFARTSGGLANQQRIMAAKLENTKAALGGQLLPVMLTAITVFQKLAHWVAENRKVVLAFATALGILWTAIKVGAALQKVEAAGGMAAWIRQTQIATKLTKLWAVAQRIFNASFLSNPIFLVIAAIVLLGVALVMAYKKSATFRAVVQAAFQGVMVVVRALGAVFAAVFRVVVGVLRAVWTVIRTVFGWIVAGLRLYARLIYAVYIWPWVKAYTVIVGLLRRLASWIPGVFTGIVGAVARALGAVGNAITGPFRAAWNWIREHIVGPMRSMFTGLAGAIAHAMGGVFDAIIGPFKSAWNWIRDHVLSPIKSAWNGIANAINSVHFSVKVPKGIPGIGGKGFTFDPPNVPTLARGGYVDRATLAVIGEGGGEIVAPVAMLRKLMREEQAPTIIVQGALDPDAVARQIESLLSRRARRVGGVTRRGVPA